jgi:hypothetical protein
VIHYFKPSNTWFEIVVEDVTNPLVKANETINKK